MFFSHELMGKCCDFLYNPNMVHVGNGMEDGRPGEFFDEALLRGSARAVRALAEAVPVIEATVPACAFDGSISAHGYFRPQEEEALFSWFAHFLTVREGLWEVLGELSGPVEGEVSRILSTFEWRCFVLGYSAACLIVRLDRFLLEKAATDALIQRKLNEGSRRFRIKRKQFTRIFESFTDPHHALLVDEARRFARKHRVLLQAMATDPIVGEHAGALPERELMLDPSRGHYLRRLAAFLSHTFRRRGASARQKTFQSVMETAGRLLAEFRDPWAEPRIGREHLLEIETHLRPGDVLITRHDLAATNLIFPGFWPHAALFVGSEHEREDLGIRLDPEREKRWAGDRRVLEALKDGVLYRRLEDTLKVDSLVVIRPRLSSEDIAVALERVSVHEGKTYNFDFDFFRSDRLVCTEVVYRAFDGLGDIDISLQTRTGRPTLSAEDLLDQALEGRGFDPLLIFGVDGCHDRVISGESVPDLLESSFSSGA